MVPEAAAVPLLAFFGFFLLFLISNFPYLTNPPYWDEITGLHNQALWLAKHNFDLKELFQPEQTSGGSLVYYPVCVLPFLYGVLYALLPPMAVFIAGHLLNLLLLAGSGCLFALLLQKFCNAKMTILWCAALFTEPILTGRMAAQGQEAALLFAAMLSLYGFFKGRPAVYISAAVLACSIKLTGIVLLIAYAVWGIAAMFFLRERAKRIATAGMVAVFLFFIALFVFLRNLFSSYPGMQGDVWGIQNMGFSLLWNHFYYYYLWIFPIAAALFGMVLYRICSKWRQWSGEELKNFLVPVFVGGYWGAYFLYSPTPPLPRYTAFVLPALYYGAAYFSRSGKTKWKITVLLFLCVLHVWNQNGTFLPKIPEGFTADLSWAERSREFLTGVANDRELCFYVAEKKPDQTAILTKWPYTQMLTIPEFGYVDRIVPIVSVGIFPKYAGATQKNLRELKGKVFWVLYAPSCMEYWFCPPRFQKPEKVPQLFETRVNNRVYSQIYPALLR